MQMAIVEKSAAPIPVGMLAGGGDIRVVCSAQVSRVSGTG